MTQTAASRTRGPMDQAQKIYQLKRGDCCLSFCGDAQIAYPLFVQVSVALDNHFRTSSRALDVTSLTGRIEKILNNMIDSWPLPTAEKAEDLAGTTILFAGWASRDRTLAFSNCSVIADSHFTGPVSNCPILGELEQRRICFLSATTNQSISQSSAISCKSVTLRHQRNRTRSFCTGIMNL